MRNVIVFSLAVLVAADLLFAAPDDTEPPPAAAGGEVQERAVFVQEANLDQWIFQGRGDARTARQQIQLSSKLQIEEADRVCQLSDAQKEKLALAAEGDIKQFFEEIEVVREKFRAVQNDPNAFNGIWEEIQPLQQKLARGLFGETSFFAKTLRKTLTAEQMSSYRANADERRQYRYRATIEAALATLENSVPLRDEQHRAILKLLMEKTQPPAAFGQYDYYLVMHQFSKLPQAELKATLDERQWELLQQQFNRFRGMDRLLIQNGVLAEGAADEREDVNREEEKKK